MKTTRFEVLSPDEVQRIHEASMQILETVGVHLEWKTAQEIFREAGPRWKRRRRASGSRKVWFKRR
jgi:trimethylamine:corrinoid methyltransferase-like protein